MAITAVRSTAWHLLVLLLASLSGAAFAADGRWSSAGPFGGRIDSALASPAEPGVVFATAHRGVFRSDDGGLNWSPASAGLATVGAGDSVIAAHPSQSGQLLIAGARGVFGSRDSGRSWTRQDAGLPTANANFRTIDIAYAKSDPSKVYLASAENGVFRSIDGGLTWLTAGGASLPSNIDRIAVDPTDAQKLVAWVTQRDLLSFPASLYRSTNGGVSFSPVLGPWDIGGLLNQPIELLAYNPNVPGSLFVSNSLGNYRSLDGGLVFFLLSVLPVLNNQRLQSLDFDPLVPGRLIFGTSNGVVLSQNNGDSFLSLNLGLNLSGGDPASIGPVVIDPANPARWLAFAYSGEVFATTNSGEAWAPVGTGLRGTQIQTIAVHPTRPQRIFAGLRNERTEATSSALYRSDDTGQSWQRFNNALALDTLNSIIFDPASTALPASTRVYAVGADFAPLGAASYRGGIFKSADGGSSWSPADTLVPTPLAGAAALGEVNTLLVDPLSASGGISQDLFFGAEGSVQCLLNIPLLNVARIWRSTNAATSWTPRDNLPLGGCSPRAQYPQPVALVGAPGLKILYAGTRLAGYCRACNDPVPTYANGVFRSLNGGQSWAAINVGLPLMSGTGSVQNVNALIQLPGSPSTLYVALEDPTQSGTPGRVFKSINGGASWTAADNGIPNVAVRSLRVETDAPNRIYAGAAGIDTSPGGVYFSDDAGANWRSISIDLPVDSAQSVALSPSNTGPATLHAGTDEGVFSLTRVPDGDFDGPADADEDFAPNGGDGNNDGIDDRLQADVASIRMLYDNARGADKGTSKESTISNLELRGVGACQQIFDAASIDPLSLPVDIGFAADAGLMRFEFINCTNAQVEVIFHDESFNADWSFRRYGPVTAGNPLGLQWMGMGNGAVRIGQRFFLSIADNAPGDLRSEPGRILFMGGAVRALPLFGDGFENP